MCVCIYICMYKRWIKYLSTCRMSSSSMRSVQLIRSTLVSEPLYSMMVPLKLISLLNMATTKFPFRRELDWLSESAAARNKQTAHQQDGQNTEEKNLWRWALQALRSWECLQDAPSIICDSDESKQCLETPSHCSAEPLPHDEKPCGTKLLVFALGFFQWLILMTVKCKQGSKRKQVHTHTNNTLEGGLG